MIRKKVLMAMLGLSLAAGSSALAQGTAVDDSGNVSMTGKITSVTSDSFVIEHGGGTSEVTFSNMNDSNIQMMRDTNILSEGSYVTVDGKLAKGDFNRPVIEARDIYVQAAPAAAD